MSRANRRLTRLLAGAIIAAVAIPAIAAELPPPSPPAGPVPVPYPDPEPPPVPECPASLCPRAAAPLRVQPAPQASAQTSARDPASGLPTGKRMHKPLALTSTDRCDTHAPPASGLASDPEEGGQIARSGGDSPDANDGGEVAGTDKAAKRKGKVSMGQMQFTKHYDTSSTTIMEAPSSSDCH